MPRAGLTPDIVVTAAADLADEVGWSAVTLAELATRLGVRQPSLYKHVDGWDGVRREVAILSRRELAEVLARSAVGRSREDALTSLAFAYRAWAKAHPGRHAATVRAPAPGDSTDHDASSAVVSVALDVLAGFGLAGADAVDAARTVRAALYGFVVIEQGNGFGLPVDVERSYDKLVAALCRALDSWPGPETG